MTTTMTTEFDQRTLRTLFGRFPSGIVAICAHVDGEPVGMAASSFTSVSLDPPLLSVCFSHTSSTWPRLRRAPRLGISVFAADQEAHVRQLSAKSGDRFQDLDHQRTSQGAVLLAGAAAWFECVPETELEGGDHAVALLRVAAARAFPDVAPLIFHDSGFHAISASSA
ncbi:flavin reductase family protein [Streptomyces sp. NPDC004542]|uniref:flavin reductase family protein n=1 Tax=Streptomyces sp. NPDC004542 TaxID=3154281 RepID=UPI0033A1D889